MATEEKRLQRKKTIRRTSTKYQRMNTQLTARMDSLIKGYEEEMTQRALQDAEQQQAVRMRSARTISGIAIGAVFLSAFFLDIDHTRYISEQPLSSTTGGSQQAGGGFACRP